MVLGECFFRFKWVVGRDDYLYFFQAGLCGYKIGDDYMFNVNGIK